MTWPGPRRLHTLGALTLACLTILLLLAVDTALSGSVLCTHSAGSTLWPTLAGSMPYLVLAVQLENLFL